MRYWNGHAWKDHHDHTDSCVDVKSSEHVDVEPIRPAPYDAHETAEIKRLGLEGLPASEVRAKIFAASLEREQKPLSLSDVRELRCLDCGMDLSSLAIKGFIGHVCTKRDLSPPFPSDDDPDTNDPEAT